MEETCEIEGVEHEVSFTEWPLKQQKETLIGLLDKNQLYINLSEMNDENMQVSDTDKQFTESFYQLGE